MSNLTSTTARTRIDEWHAVSTSTWSGAELDALESALISLSESSTPHVVQDATVSEADQQEYFLVRAIGRTEDWLSRCANGSRRALAIGAPVLSADGSARSVGLRSATLDELDSLPGIGDVRALDIAQFVTHARVTSIEGLVAVDGIGPQTVAGLSAVSHLEQPRAALVSHSLVQFANSPSIPSYIRLLDKSDLEFHLGDGDTLERRELSGGSTAIRLLRMLEFAREQAERTLSPSSGVLMSEIQSWNTRHKKRIYQLAQLEPVSGNVLVNETYVAAARALIESAQTSIRLMVFLGTTAGGDELEPGPLELVEALEAKAAAGVSVQVVLDQDDGGEPYKSYFINKGLVERFQAGPVQVKFDEKDTLLHSKVLIVDAEATILGSHNWTKSGFNDTHELSVLIRSQPTATQFSERFQLLWESLP